MRAVCEGGMRTSLQQGLLEARGGTGSRQVLCDYCQTQKKHSLQGVQIMKMLIQSCKQIADVIHHSFQEDTCICYPSYVNKRDSLVDLRRDIIFPDTFHTEFIENLLRLVRPSNNEKEGYPANSRIVRHPHGTSKILIPLLIDRKSNRVIKLGYTQCYASEINSVKTDRSSKSQEVVASEIQSDKESSIAQDTSNSSKDCRRVEIVVDYDPPPEFSTISYRVRTSQQRFHKKPLEKAENFVSSSHGEACSSFFSGEKEKENQYSLSFSPDIPLNSTWEELFSGVSEPVLHVCEGPMNSLGSHVKENCVYIVPESIFVHQQCPVNVVFKSLTMSVVKPLNIYASYHASRGRRAQMEDRVVVSLDLHGKCGISPLPDNKKACFFGVYDGHGGLEVVDYVSRHFHRCLTHLESYTSGVKTLQQLLNDCSSFRSRCIIDTVISLLVGYSSGDLGKEIKEALRQTFDMIESKISGKLSYFLEIQKKCAKLKRKLKQAGRLEGVKQLESLTDPTAYKTNEALFCMGDEDLIQRLINQIEFYVNSYEAILQGTLPSELEETERCEEDVHASNLTSGSTASVVLIRDNTLYVANLGDSRCVISRCGRIACLTEDHRLASSEKEVIRVNQTPETFSCDGYLCGQLAVSRAFGNIERCSGKKLPGLLSLPDIIEIKIRQDDEFLIIGSDGLFDSLTPIDATVIIRKALEETHDLEYATKKLVDYALEKSEDNISAIVVLFFNGGESWNSREMASEIQEDSRVVRAGYEKYASELIADLALDSEGKENGVTDEMENPNLTKDCAIGKPAVEKCFCKEMNQVEHSSSHENTSLSEKSSTKTFVKKRYRWNVVESN